MNRTEVGKSESRKCSFGKSKKKPHKNLFSRAQTFFSRYVNRAPLGLLLYKDSTYMFPPRSMSQSSLAKVIQSGSGKAHNTCFNTEES